MRVYVAIPTYRNFGRTIGKTLEALAKQTYRDFKVLIIYKLFPGDRTLDVIDEFRDKLDIEVIVQNEGYFEEAMNMAYRNADGDILITTDDDAVPEPNWIETYISLHRQYPKAGVIGGGVIPTDFERRIVRSTIFTKIVHYAIGFYNPLLDELENYISYYNDMGIFVVKDGPLKDFEIRQTMWVIGANMSIERAIYKDFKLPCSTIRGSEYEFLLALHAILKGFKVLKTSIAKVVHLERESLSRPRDPRLAMIEWGIAPYNVYRIYGYINTERLKLYIKVLKILKIMKRSFKRQSPYIESLLLALPIALQAIEEDRPPKWVRSRLELLARRIRSI